MQAFKQLFAQLGKIWSQLGINQKVIIVASGGAILACIGALVLWSGRTDYGLLYGRLELSEAGKIVRDQALNAAHQALSFALQTVRAADQTLRGAGSGSKAKKAKAKAATVKKAAKKTAKKAKAAVRKTVAKAKKAARKAKR